MILKDATAIITGSTGGLGAEIARALASAGCNCICHYYEGKEKAQRLVKELKEYKIDAAAISADLRDRRQVENFFKKLPLSETPRILINSAAIFKSAPLGDVTFEDAEAMIKVNLIAPIIISREFVKKLKLKSQAGGLAAGKIINISDIAAVRPWANYVVYSASKAALDAATKALAKELAPDVTVNAVAPGIVTWPAGFDSSAKKKQLKKIKKRFRDS